MLNLKSVKGNTTDNTSVASNRYLPDGYDNYVKQC